MLGWANFKYGASVWILQPVRTLAHIMNIIVRGRRLMTISRSRESLILCVHKRRAAPQTETLSNKVFRLDSESEWERRVGAIDTPCSLSSFPSLRLRVSVFEI